jgi:hypothetical protein
MLLESPGKVVSREEIRKRLWGDGADRQLMAASYTVHGDSFLPDAPHVYSKKIVVFQSTRSYDPAPGGKQIVTLTAADTSRGSGERLVFLLNFYDELRRRVPLNGN